jgi:hemoglobin
VTRLPWRLVAALLVVAACDRGPRPVPPTPRPPLYQRVGGIAALRAVVDELAARLAADPELADRFASVDFRTYKRHLLAELCGLTGGPCRVRAGEADAAPAGLAEGWLAHLDAAAAATGLSPELREELVRRLAPRAAALALAPE